MTAPAHEEGQRFTVEFDGGLYDMQVSGTDPVTMYGVDRVDGRAVFGVARDAVRFLDDVEHVVVTPSGHVPDEVADRRDELGLPPAQPPERMEP